MIVTIDGPAGAGKSSAARELAIQLGFRFLDTGAMYRAVTLAAFQESIDLDNSTALGNLVQNVTIELESNKVLLNGKDVTDAIRTFEVTTATRYAADHLGVRERLVELQREIVGKANYVTEGRDQATVAFPNAECKLFLTASEEVRAERRFQDLIARGEDLTYDEVLKKQRQRDQRDVERPVGGLRKPADAIEVNTDGMSPGEVVEELCRIVRKHQEQLLKKECDSPS